jgi:hypothetical protein
MTEIPKIERYGLGWYNDKGQPHREGDLPAMIEPDGSVYYCKNGNRHRDGDKPAVIFADGSVSYYKYDKWYKP